MLPLAVFTLLAAGCPGDDSSTETSTSSTATASGTDTGTASGTGTSTASGTDTSTASGSGDSTGSGPGTATDSGGAACGEANCGAAEYCDWGVNSCGTQDFDEGTCAPSPEGCDAVYQPVCGCDGEVYGNQCEANGGGVDVDAEGDCTAPEGYFGCGYRFCDSTFEYCQVAVSDIGGEPDVYACQVPAEACDPLSCDCLTNEPCFDFSCEETPDGGIVIICPGG